MVTISIDTGLLFLAEALVAVSCGASGPTAHSRLP